MAKRFRHLINLIEQCQNSDKSDIMTYNIHKAIARKAVASIRFRWLSIIHKDCEISFNEAEMMDYLGICGNMDSSIIREDWAGATYQADYLDEWLNKKGFTIAKLEQNGVSWY